MELTEQLTAALDSPEELERLYRRDPRGFEQAFPDLLALHPDSLILQTWQARLSYMEVRPASSESGLRGSFLVVLLVALAAGTLLILPNFVEAFKADWWLLRNVPMIVLLALIAYFVIRKYPGGRILSVLVVLSAAAAIYINLLPDPTRSDTILLSTLHLPFIFWALFGLAYAGKEWRETGARVNFIRFNGDLFIYSTLFVLGSGVLVGLATALFSLLSNQTASDFSEFFMRYLFWYGLVAIPLLATFLIERIPGGKIPFASILARVFSPLFLILVVGYLLAVLASQKSPFLDRDVLIVFNVLLAVVLAISIFSILERPANPRGSTQDIINLALAVVTLLLDGLALAAILFRLTSYGLTPNRIAVLGANLLFFVHLVGICFFYIRLLARRGSLDQLEGWIVQYLPAYAVWVVFVTVAFPLIFHFH